jgi:hypothetical protein
MTGTNTRRDTDVIIYVVSRLQSYLYRSKFQTAKELEKVSIIGIFN